MPKLPPLREVEVEDYDDPRKRAEALRQAELERLRALTEEQLSALTGGFAVETFMQIQERQQRTAEFVSTLGLTGSADIERECCVCFEKANVGTTSCNCTLVCESCYEELNHICPMCNTTTQLT